MDRVKKSYAKVEKAMLSWNLKKLTTGMLSIAVIVGLVSTFFWYNNVYMTNERRFWAAIDNSMSTKSVVRTLTNGGTGNQVVQQNRFYFGEDTIAESRVEFTNRSATVDTSVVTEGVTTLDSQFSRYIAFETNDTRENGSTPNLDSVLGQWSGETADESAADDARLNYVSELVTLAIFGDFDPAFRSSVIETFKQNDVYRTNFENAVNEVINGETYVTYSVSIGLRQYAEQLQQSFVRAGLGDFPPLNPENYREDSRIAATFLLDKSDNTIRGIQFGDRQEQYANYGVQKEVELPTPVFTPQELEATVQEQIQG